MSLIYHKNAFLKYLCILCLIQTAVGLDIVYTRTEPTPRIMDDINKFSSDVHCQLQANRYKCGKYRTEKKYYFDISRRECVQFEYGNCQNSFNLFESRKLCVSQCQDAGLHTTPENLTENVYCRFQPDFGNCNGYHPMYYFDISDYQCKGFSFSGCGGNHNRFPNSQICTAVCGAVVKQY